MNEFVAYTILDIIIYNIISVPLILKLLYYKRFVKIKFNRIYIWLLFFIFCVEARYSGDWIHYKDIVQNRYSGYWEWSNLETVYEMLIYHLKGNYIAFRMIVWGCALFFLFRLFKRLQIHNQTTLFVFSICGLYMFAYPRVSLGLSLFFWGYSYLIKKYDNENSIKNLIKAICIISFSCLFHKSILILIILLPFSFINYTRKKIHLLVFTFYFIVTIIDRYLNLMIGDEIFAGIEYFNGDEESSKMTIGSKINTLSHNIPIYWLFFTYMYKYSIRSKISTLSIQSKRLYSLCFCIFFLSLIFLFLQLNSTVLYYRTLYMILIPLICLIVVGFNEKVWNNHQFIVIGLILAYIGNNYSLMYNLLGHINGTIQ